ncbi:hypothetical protein JRQ81_004680 [Phrynocephalus forsythii]|uniref:Ig-like domain-containing protein n=1 Tax=Phrynocephalus forsythii TaxID=171643 RepID=A0A9Q0XG49_9SAUR|nr:hypothetical protein JRQ81_004680 [Phrynocephalus forsythii]
MESLVYLFLSLLFWIQGTRGQIVLTQSPKSLFLSVGDPATIKCQSDTDIDDDMNWYQQKPDQPPRLLFSEGNTRREGVPARFSSSGYGEDFTLAISSVEAEDAGYYHCQQSDRTPLHSDTKQYINPCDINGSDGQTIITQTPQSFQANPGDRMVIQCKASSSVGSYMALYQFIEGQNPKLLIYGSSTRFGGTPDRFSGSGSGTDFSFTINNIRPEDEAEYYCGQYNSLPLTVIHFSTKTKWMD